MSKINSNIEEDSDLISTIKNVNLFNFKTHADMNLENCLSNTNLHT